MEEFCACVLCHSGLDGFVLFFFMTTATYEELYRLLGCSSNSSKKNIEKSFKRLGLKHHPDKNGGDPAVWAEMTRAKQILTDPVLRAAYDEGGMPKVVEEEQRGERMTIGTGTEDGEDDENDEDIFWVEVPNGTAVPYQSTVRFDVSTGKTYVRHDRRQMKKMMEKEEGKLGARWWRNAVNACRLLYKVCLNYQITSTIQLRIRCGCSNLEFEICKGRG